MSTCQSYDKQWKLNEREEIRERVGERTSKKNVTFFEEKREINRRSDETDQHKQIGSFFDQGLLGVVSLQSRSTLLV